MQYNALAAVLKETHQTAACGKQTNKQMNKNLSLKVSGLRSLWNVHHNCKGDHVTLDVWQLPLPLPGTRHEKVPLCSQAEIEGSKMFPRTHEIDIFKNHDKYA